MWYKFIRPALDLHNSHEKISRINLSCFTVQLTVIPPMKGGRIHSYIGPLILLQEISSCKKREREREIILFLHYIIIMMQSKVHLGNTCSGNAWLIKDVHHLNGQPGYKRGVLTSNGCFLQFSINNTRKMIISMWGEPSLMASGVTI